MDETAIRRHIRELDRRSWREQEQRWHECLHELGSRVVPYLLEFYPEARHWLTRAHLVNRATPYARTTEDAFQLGLRACADRSTHVRYRACELLAYAQRDEALPVLERLRTHPDPRTVADADAAIDAIRSQNHHWWRDRDHSDASSFSSGRRTSHPNTGMAPRIRGRDNACFPALDPSALARTRR